MTLKEALSRAREVLAPLAITDTSIEAEILLRHVLGISQAELYLRLEQSLTPEQFEAFWHLIERRLNYEPITYIIGYREFYGLTFYIDRRVLIPRPETELLVEKALEFAHNFLPGSTQPLSIADIGTGSGVIAVNLALNLPQSKIYATDISAPALEVAAINCARHRVNQRVTLLLGNLLEPVPEPVDLIVANLPYIGEAASKNLSPEITQYEPLEALLAGHHGLKKIRGLIKQAKDKLTPEGGLLLEIGLSQSEEVITLARSSFPEAKIQVFRDLGGIERIISLTC